MSEPLSAAIDSCAESVLITWGAHSAIVKSCEEMGELITVLCKRLNGSPVSDEAIIDEVADVLIIAHQMRKAFGVEKVNERVRYKLERTLKKIRQLNHLNSLQDVLPGMAPDSCTEGGI